MCSAQQKRYLRLERERLLPSVVIPIDEPLVERPTCSTSDQASTSAFLSAVSLTSTVVASADLLLYGQGFAVATLAKAAITMIAMITVPPKKAMFG